jgi:hypothetical protein
MRTAWRGYNHLYEETGERNKNVGSGEWREVENNNSVYEKGHFAEYEKFRRQSATHPRIGTA